MGCSCGSNDRSEAATSFAKNFLLGHSGVGNDINKAAQSRTRRRACARCLPELLLPAYFHTAVGDPRVPDIFGISQYGTVFTGGQAKVAEHGGANPQDRNVPLVVSGASVDHSVNGSWVETTQIARPS